MILPPFLCPNGRYHAAEGMFVLTSDILFLYCKSVRVMSAVIKDILFI